MTPEEIAALYLEEAKGDLETAFQNLCADTAELQAELEAMRRTAFHRRANFSVRAPKPRPKAIDA